MRTRMQKEEGRTQKEDEPAPPLSAPREIGERTLDYGVRAVRLFRVLQATPDRAGWIVGRQFLRAATSVGANVAEAQSGESRKDFVHKLHVALKEARESLYWLRLMERAQMLSDHRLSPLLGETDEIIAVLVAIIRSARRNQ